MLQHDVRDQCGQTRPLSVWFGPAVFPSTNLPPASSQRNFEPFVEEALENDVHPFFLFAEIEDLQFPGLFAGDTRLLNQPANLHDVLVLRKMMRQALPEQQFAVVVRAPRALQGFDTFLEFHSGVRLQMVGAQKQVGVVGDAPVDGMVGVQFVPPAHGLPAELAETRCGLPRVQGAPKSKDHVFDGLVRAVQALSHRSVHMVGQQKAKQVGGVVKRLFAQHCHIFGLDITHAPRKHADKIFDRDGRRFSRHRCGGCRSVCLSVFLKAHSTRR